MKFYISPSIIASNFTNLKKEIEKIESFDQAFVHLDIMDGNFVPNITFGPFIVEQMRKITNLPFDTHLMIKNPDNFVEEFALAGSDFITFHIEETVFPLRILKKIQKLGKKCGISFNPATPVESVVEVLPYTDIVLVMSVEPGFSGQTFIPSTLSKIEKLNELRKSNGYNFLISVDGGINEKTMKSVLDAGADILVMGSFFFKNDLSFVKGVVENLRRL
ncbi:MAG: ribulose-phosphate 3-epimerase [Caldisericaceae bacterium]